jgi:hypothetical protein
MSEKILINFAEALDQTIDECGIQVQWLAGRADVSPQMISSYRNRKQQIKTDSLEKIISALPIEAKQAYFNKLGVHSGDLLSAIDAMNDDQLGLLLSAIAAKLRQSQRVQELISA